jgi:basic membrane lipoprotein Med (substrate-binding protein (PBP1-ABC) superfamily)/DNA-binding SARP family transcriptional activator
VDFRILGSLEVASDGTTTDLGPPKQRAVLAVLLLHGGEIVPTDRLIELVWGAHPPRTAAHSVQIYVSELRKILESATGAPVILTRPPGYLLQVDPESIDARRFERLVLEGTRELGVGDRPRGATTLRAALGLWRGPPLSDFTYEDFAQPDIRHLEELRLDAIEELAEAEIAADNATGVLPLLEAAIQEDPLRERSRELQLLALYRAGRQAEALRAFQQYQAILAEELGLDPSPSLRRLQERILLHDPSLAPAAAIPGPTPVRNPYKGLCPFSEEDAGDFFGREGLVRELLAALAHGHRLIAVVGPSGCGKSSVVSAGLVPALRIGEIPGSEGWLIAQMLPGRQPFQELEAALLRAAPIALGGLPELSAGGTTALVRAVLRVVPPGGRLVLVIDQFEELFALADDRDRRRFLRNLVATVTDPHDHTRIVLTLRADFYDRPLAQPGFGRVFVPGVVSVLPMTPEEIEAAVVRPAQGVGVQVEPALLAELVADTADQPGALPLLQYALTELFERRTGPALTLDGYRAVGGLPGALSRRAEEVYGRLDEGAREIAREVFLRLVNLGQGARDSRRRVPLRELTELRSDPVGLSSVLEEFGRHRLISFDRDPMTGDATVEAAHEALLWEWERLAGWIDVYRGDLRRHDALIHAVGEWEASGRDPDYLLTGGRLDELEAWSRATQLRLTEPEQGFLDEAVDRRETDRVREESRVKQQRRLERRARRRLVGLVTAIVMLVGAATYGGLLWLGNRPPDVALLLETGEGSFQTLLAQGFDRAVSEFELDAEQVPVPTELAEAELRRLSEEGVDLILTEARFANVNTVAAHFPDTDYVVIDFTGQPRRSLPNVSYLSFAANQGSFLAGAAAALKSRTGIIGYIGGVDWPIIHEFQAGYEAGAQAVDPNIEVRSTYLTEYFDPSGFESPTLAWHVAQRLFRHGADVIFHAASNSGRGVFRAAAEIDDWHAWAIGVDVDQYQEFAAMDPEDVPPEIDVAAWPSHVLTSMVKRFDVAIRTALEEYSREVFTPGLRVLGLAESGVDLAYSGGFIDDIRRQIEDLRAKIVSGEIIVPSKPAKA